MKSIKFPEASIIYDGEVNATVFRSDDHSLQQVTCWKPTLVERIKILFGKNIWLRVTTRDARQMQNTCLSVNKKEVLPTINNEENK